MNKKVKEKWVKALKSGRYKQTYSQLKDNTGYCCLGVYCKVRKWKIEENGLNIVKHKKEVGYTPLYEEIGEDNVSKLYALNDFDRLTFPEIALYIENGL